MKDDSRITKYLLRLSGVGFGGRENHEATAASILDVHLEVSLFDGTGFVNPDLDVRSFQDAYSLFDFPTGLQSLNGDWRVTALVKNVTDEKYMLALGNCVALGNFGCLGSKIVRLGMPRSFGIRVAIHF